MVRPTDQHTLLCKSNVLFLGYSPPTPNELELRALSEPLRKAYPPVQNLNEIEGINAYVTIFSSGIQLQHVDGRDPLVFWFPIQNLYLAAANQCVTYYNSAGEITESKFVELSKPEAQNNSHAPLFSFISQISGGSEMQAYTFMTKSDAAAFALVEAAKTAYEDKSGHVEGRIPSEVSSYYLLDVC